MSEPKPNNPQKPLDPVAKAAIDDFLKKNIDWTAKPKDDLTLLFESFEAKCGEVMKLSAPIAEAGINFGSIHTTKGRSEFMLTLHKLFLDQFHSYNEEELLFLLAWTQAKLLSDHYV